MARQVTGPLRFARLRALLPADGPARSEIGPTLQALLGYAGVDAERMGTKLNRSIDVG